ncbi:MAG: hypothetical protein ACT4P1_11345 [Sporichthyaceae bacterium]
MAGLLKQLFGGGDRAIVPAQLLPLDGSCTVPGICRLSLVWPWFEVPDRLPLVDEFDRDVGVTPVLELTAPRSDDDVSLIMWVEAVAEPTGETVVGPEWGSSVTRAYPGSRVEVNAPIALNGAVGRLARVSNGTRTAWRVIVPRFNSTVLLDVSVPAAHADAYWVQIETMLATWGWES